MCKVSVVMPTYNAGKFLREAIDSILSQTFQDFEILVIDDNSQDDTLEILKLYDDNRIKIIPGDCSGLASALNKGILLAKGDYIARMDADDIALPQRFEKEVLYLDNHPEICLVGSWQRHFGNINRIHTPHADADMAKCSLVFECDLCHSTIMFRRSEFISKNLFYPENSPQEDYELWCKAIGCIKIANIPEILGLYRVFGESITDKKEYILADYEAKLIAKNLKNYFNIYLSDEELKLIKRRNNEYWKLPLKGKIVFQKNLDRIYSQIEKSNANIKFVSQKSLKFVLQKNWQDMCNRECYIKTSYAKRTIMKQILQFIFSLTNEYSKKKKHKVITICGIKFKYLLKQKVSK